MKKKKSFKYSLLKLSFNREKKYKIRYGNFSIKSTNQGLINQKHLENLRRKLSKQLKKFNISAKSKIYIRSPLWKPYTAKPLLSRMGKGAGNVVNWMAWVKLGYILIEITTSLSFFFVYKIVKKARKLFPLQLILTKKSNNINQIKYF